MVRHVWGSALLLLLFLIACGAPAAPRITASDVVAAFQAAGLEAASRPLTREDYGPAPYLCSDGAQRLLIASLGDDAGGRVFVCPNTEDANRLTAFYDELGASSAMFFSHTFQRDTIVVQLSGDLDEATAQRYRVALEAMP